MKDYLCESLAKHHDRDAFDCGVPVLNHYLQRVASQDIKRRAAAVFVMTHVSEPKRVVGFYTLCSTSIELASIPQKLAARIARYPDVPAILVGRLARDVHCPGLGNLLLADAIRRCVRVASEIAATLIVVDSKDEAAAQFYSKYGFMSLPNYTARMFLPLANVDKP